MSSSATRQPAEHLAIEVIDSLLGEAHMDTLLQLGAPRSSRSLRWLP